MPTALEAGRYSSNGCHRSRQRQYVRATGLPALSTCASAPSRSGVMMAVECLWKRCPYRRHVSGGVLPSEPLRGKNSSVGLRSTWYVRFTEDQIANTPTPTTMIWIARGAADSARNARATRRRSAAIRARRARILPAAALTTRACGMSMACHYYRRRGPAGPRGVLTAAAPPPPSELAADGQGEHLQEAVDGAAAIPLLVIDLS